MRRWPIYRWNHNVRMAFIYRLNQLMRGWPLYTGGITMNEKVTFIYR